MKHFIKDQILERGVNLLKVVANACQLSVFAFVIICLASKRALRACSSCSRQMHRLKARMALRRIATAR